MKYEEQEISGFGKYPKVKSKIYRPATVTETIESISKPNETSVIARGLGRSYGDASLNENNFVSEDLLLNKYISFDEQTGVLKCEPGVSIEDILETFVPRGWFPPVTPGTKYVTIGGAIASDIHGKNHHKDGSFSNFLNNFTILTSDRNFLNCSREENSDLFWATIGGMGLTGIITDAEIRLKKIESPFINFKSIRFTNLDSLVDAFEKYDNDFVYSVAWIDVLAKGSKTGKSVLLLGNHSEKKDLPQKFSSNTFHPKKKKNVPVELPSFTLNRLTVGLFNKAYYLLHSDTDTIVDYDTFFYPLDSILNWNNVYGKKGFAQYQLCVPEEKGQEAIRKILNKVTEYHGYSFVSVLKKMGEHTGILSFPIKGYTLSMDFPVRSNVTEMIKELDKIVMDYGGRTYLTKDAFLDENTFKKMYDGYWQKWREIKQKYDPQNLFGSNLSRRIGLCQY